MAKKFTKLQKHDVQSALDYIQNQWSALTHDQIQSTATLVGLPNAFVVPSNEGDTFSFQEQYYWDTYFILIGLDDEQLALGMLDNLIHMYKTFGLIPNASRYYLTSRSQPPLLTSIIFHLYDTYGLSESWLSEKISIAKHEYQHVWVSEQYPHPRKVYKNLSRYFDLNWLHDLAEAESGWDMTPRFKRQCLDYLPVDLNSFLYRYEKDFEKAFTLLGQHSEARTWAHRAEERRKTMTELMWHKRKVFFFDYNFRTKSQGSVWSLAAYTTLWSEMASTEQARKLVKNLDRFEKKGGLTTTTTNFMYTELFGSNKTQWAYPNTWAPLEFFVIEGLERYGYFDIAERLAHTWMKTVVDWHHDHGEMLEKYNAVNPNLKPAQGLYPTQTGFGWTNGVFIHLANKYIA